MKKRLAVAGLAVAAFVFAACREAAAPASSGSLTPSFDVGGGQSGMSLHPSGFGEHSLAAWKAKEGLPDNHGKADHALYFQKFTETPTFAAGVAIVDGLEGLPATALTILSWEHRNDGWCGAGAPRWNIGLTDASGGFGIAFLGCNAAAHIAGSAPDWTKDSWNVQAEIAAAIVLYGLDAGTTTIRGLAIVFDEGTDVPANPGFVYLDNIIVNSTRWTSPADNSK
ncbi:MAG TPA: hypothetical protein VJ755_10920 [Gemmatimonadales bacterium]|nr:hypothetical protein [Gemmatimonadales bacterium]